MAQTTKTPKTVGVIPARFASTRLPGKPLTLINGKPLLQWVIEGVRTSRRINEIVVATDHPDILKLANGLGANGVMTDPNCPTGTDRCYQAVKSLDFDFAVNIQGDEPLITGEVLDKLVEGIIAEGPNGDIATLVSALKPEDLGNLSVAKVVRDLNFRAVYFSRLPIPYTRLGMDQYPDAALKHVGVYAFSKSAFKKFCNCDPTPLELAESLEQLRALSIGLKIKLVKVDHESIGVDTPEDVKRVEALLWGKGKR